VSHVKGPAAAPITHAIPGRVRALSCASSAVCFAVALADNATRWGVIRITDHGAHSHPSLAKKNLTLVAISCPSLAGCDVLAENSKTQVSVVLPVTRHGVIGKPLRLGPTSKDALSAIACYPTRASCTLVGAQGDVIDVVTVDHTTITRKTLTLPANAQSGSIAAVACPTTQCYAVGSVSVHDKVQGLVVPILNGVPGNAVDVPSASNLGMLGIACISASRCFAVGDGSHGVIYALTNATVTHSTGLAKSVLLFGIACQAAHSCDAVGSAHIRHGVVIPISYGRRGPLQVTSVTTAYGSEAGAADPIAGFAGGIEIAGVDAARPNDTVISST
jgi:hypothetical protein